MAVSDFARQAELERAYLLRVARLQLRDAAAAEDVVQDTLVAALEGAERFAGRSSLRTWMVGILKHKIIDALRMRMRQPSWQGPAEEADLDGADDYFDRTGHWSSPPAVWQDASSEVESKEFLAIMDMCLDKLPPNQGRVFMLREVFELEAEEICKSLNVTSTNLWVLLYRARLALRECLEQNGLAPASR